MSHLLGALLTAALAVSTFAHAGAVMLLLGSWQAWRRPRAPIGLAPTLYAAAGIAAWAVVGDPAPVTAVAVGLAATGWRIRIRSSFSVLGSFVFATAIQAAVIGACWVGWFIATVPVGPTTRTLMLVAFALLVLGVPARLIQMYESLNILCRKQWTRARTPLSPGSAVRSPKVSVHVPVHSEPPEVVNAALDSLAALRYPTFEVLVVDNNTSDADLWRPVQAHCLKLGSRFRFFHVARLPGAKAGALNFALRHTSPDAEIVAPLDAINTSDRTSSSGSSRLRRRRTRFVQIDPGLSRLAKQALPETLLLGGPELHQDTPAGAQRGGRIGPRRDDVPNPPPSG